MSTPAEQASELRSDVAALQSMLREVEYEYTPKKRLAVIAEASLHALVEMYEKAANAAETESQRVATDSGLIVSPAGLVMP